MRLGRLIGSETFTRIALLAAGIAFPIGALELVVHGVEASRGPMFPGGSRTLSFSSPDSLLGWRHEPDFSRRYGWPEHPDRYLTIATNNLGLREDTPTSEQPQAGSFRVLVLGDSQTDGLLNNSESWPNILEAFSQPDPGPWEVLNAGVTGYRLWHYYTWWREYGRSLGPDLVLLGYYLGNDLVTGADENIAQDGVSAPPGAAAGGTEVPPRSRLRTLFLSFRHRCRLCALASFVGHRFVLDGPTYEESLFVGGSDEDEERRYLEAIRHCIGCLWQSVEQQWRIAGDEERYSREISLIEVLIRRLRDEVERDGARLAVVLIPTKLQIEPGAGPRALTTARLLGMKELDFTLEDRLEADMRSLLQQLDVPVIEVRTALEAAHTRTGQRLYYDADWHLNVMGSRVVGEAVAAELLDSDRH